MTEPFLAVNQNIEYTDFRALPASGELIYRSDDIYERYILPEEEIKALSGEFILTGEGNVYYLHTDLSDDPVRKEPAKYCHGPGRIGRGWKGLFLDVEEY